MAISTITLKISDEWTPDWSRRELRIITKVLRAVYGAGPRAQTMVVRTRSVFLMMKARTRFTARANGLRHTAWHYACARVVK